MKALNKIEINKTCNEIAENGDKPYALVKVSAEMPEVPKDAFEIFYADTMPQVVSIVDSKDEALELLAEQGAPTAKPFGSPAGTLYDCEGFIVFGMMDEFEYGEHWEIDTDDASDEAPKHKPTPKHCGNIIKFELFSQLYRETADYTDAEMYIGERGWQADWMDELDDAGVNIGKLLLDIWELSKMDIVQLRKRAGLTQVGFAERYSVPYRTVQNWEGNGTARHEPGGYIKMLIAYTLIEV